MVANLQTLCLIAVLAPLIGSFISGVFRNQVGRTGAHSVTIIGVMISFIFSLMIANAIFIQGHAASESIVYTWASGGALFPYQFHIGFLIDSLTTLMMLIVTFVSLLVHVYTIGYMVHDDGYQRFFSYISLFTFMMLTLVTSNNFLQLFFGWEGVGLVSYLLIGFWYKRESALQGSIKAFLVNRVGDFGFLLGIAAVLAFTGSLDYREVFKHAPQLAEQFVQYIPGVDWSMASVICILLFVGAMGKSAQVPLHIWLPESMEGPTPISALIHAATMVTAGVFMVARMSPLFEYSDTALSFIMIIGATGALFTGLIAIVMNDIKRVVAYSTLSQLGYMMVALGASAYSAGVFHLATHACFKALLFLGAGSVIVAMHHEQDMRKMGGLWKYMPITYITYVIGTLALCAIPPFSGFYSKDIIIEAVHESTLSGAGYAYFCVLTGAIVTVIYSFRSLFMTFHTVEKMDPHTKKNLHESPLSITLPLIVLAIPSIILGAMLIQPILFSDTSLLSDAITVLPRHDVLQKLGHHYHGALGMMIDALFTKLMWLVLMTIVATYLAYVRYPHIPDVIAEKCSFLRCILLRKFGFDDINNAIFIRGSLRLGDALYRIADQRLIDGLFVNGLGLTLKWTALRGRLMQTGFLFHYALAMVSGLFIFLIWLLLG